MKVITIKHRIQWYICVVLYTCVSIEKWVSINVWVSRYRYYTHRIAQIYVSYWRSFDWLNCYILNRKWVRVTLSWALPYVAKVFNFCNVCNIKSYTFLVNPRLLKSRFCEHYHCSVQVCCALEITFLEHKLMILSISKSNNINILLAIFNVIYLAVCFTQQVTQR